MKTLTPIKVSRVALSLAALMSLTAAPSAAAIPNINGLHFTFEHSTDILDIVSENIATGAFTGTLNGKTIAGTVYGNGRMEFTENFGVSHFTYSGALRSDIYPRFFAGTYQSTNVAPVRATPFCANGTYKVQ